MTTLGAHPAAAHVVHFYRDDAELTNTVAAHLAGALCSGGAGVVVATPAHVQLFVAGMQRRGVDVPARIADGTLILLDAAETLAEISVSGRPDLARFDTVIGAVIGAAGTGGRPVQAYGEMVGLLWDDGLVAEAVELENLWNRLGERVPFALLCGYPAASMMSAVAARGYGDICATHTSVVAGAPVPLGAQVTRNFPAGLHAPAAARQFVTERLAEFGLDELTEAARLCVSELATNAVRHAGSAFSVSLTRGCGRIRLVVGDRSAALPERQHPDCGVPHGRGLLLVGVLGDSWGCDPVEDGKLVWVELCLDPVLSSL